MLYKGVIVLKGTQEKKWVIFQDQDDLKKSLTDGRFLDFEIHQKDEDREKRTIINIEEIAYIEYWETKSC